MNIMNLERIQKTLGNRQIFRCVTAGIEEGDRIGVIGKNGTGKSTILSIAAGVTEPDDGEVICRTGLRISYLPQDPVFDPERSILENVSVSVFGEDEHWNIQGEARAMLKRLGIPDPDVSPAVLSGGQKKRAALAAALLTPCGLLILDEPTNHLDHEMIEWLQNWLETYTGALLMVTHDRYFLDEVTDQIWEIDKADIYRYKGNYEVYLQKKQERMDFARAAERKMAQLYKQDLAWMQRGARARATKQKAHIQRFEDLKNREKIVEDRNVQIASLPSRLGNKTIEVRDLAGGYGDTALFHDFNYTFLKTDRVGIIGPNGCGKSTLLKVLLQIMLPLSGSVDVGQTVRFGYFGQEYMSGSDGAGNASEIIGLGETVIDDRLRVIDFIKDGAEFIRTTEGLVSASSMCERFLFDSEQQYTPLYKLSGGEKRRLYLLRVLMEAPNVIVLDEPTNDLDIQTLQILEDYLDHFPGIVITVSHDRYFLDRVVNRIFVFEADGTLTQSEGGYEDYRNRLEAEGTGESTEKETGGKTDPALKEEASRNKKRVRKERPKTELSYKEKRELESLEGLIDSLTETSGDLDRQIEEAATDYIRLQELSAEKEKVEAELEEKIERYFYLQELAESFEKKD